MGVEGQQTSVVRAGVASGKADAGPFASLIDRRGCSRLNGRRNQPHHQFGLGRLCVAEVHVATFHWQASGPRPVRTGLGRPQARPRQAHNKKTQSPQFTTRDMSGLYVSAESMLLEFRINVA